MSATTEQLAHRRSTLSRSRLGLMLLSVLCLCVMVAELALGPVTIPPDRILAVLSGSGTQAEHAIFWQIRAPRMLLGIATGVALAFSGAALQGLLRNPLAEPGLIGVTAGASMGAVTVIVLGGALLVPAVIAPFMLPLAAFIGSAVVVAILFVLAAGGRGQSITILILAGVALNAIAGAFIGVLVYISDDQQLRDLTFWTMGSLGTAQAELVVIVSCLALATVPVFVWQTRALDLLQLGDRAAFHSGLNVTKSRLLIGGSTALSVGAVTCAAGPIGFIGLVAPHIARLLFGPVHAVLLPAAALIGVVLVLSADLAVRMAVPPAEPPIGLATSLIGGPFFLWLVLNQIRKGQRIA